MKQIYLITKNPIFCIVIYIITDLLTMQNYVFSYILHIDYCPFFIKKTILLI